MDSFEINKIAGGVLAVGVFTLGMHLLADGLFAAHRPAKPGFEIAVVEPEAKPSGPAAPEVPIAELLAKADPAKGEVAAKKCVTCHDFTKGGPNKVGPNLWAVVDRTQGTHEGFNYSATLKSYAAKGEKWSYEQLNAFIKSPRTAHPGTTMAFAGISRDSERGDLIAYLRTLANSPVPLPQ